MIGRYAPDAPPVSGGFTRRPAEDEDTLDEWAACGIEQAEDIKALFVDRFWFGCEADDPMTSLAFNTKVNPFGGELKVMMGSDISHWDLPDVAEVLQEAYEMVEHDWIDDCRLRDFVFTNPASLLHRDQPLASSRARWSRRPSTS